MANKNSIYINALTSFILDTKPYHSKLTEIQEIYQFADSMTVHFEERLFSTVMTKAAWPYSYFSPGNQFTSYSKTFVSGDGPFPLTVLIPLTLTANQVVVGMTITGPATQVGELTIEVSGPGAVSVIVELGVGFPMTLHQLVSPLSRGFDRNDDPLNSRGAFKAFRDENTDLPLVPLAFDPKCLQGIGLADAFVQRDGLTSTSEPILEGRDVFLSHGAYTFQIKQALSTQPLVVGRFTDSYEVTDGPFPLVVTLPFSNADSLVVIGPATQLTLNSILVGGPGLVTVTGLSADPNYHAEFTERRNEGLLATVTSTTQSNALNMADPLSAVNQIKGIMNQISAQLILTPNAAASAELAAVMAILNTPLLPSSYEALMNALVAAGTPVLLGYVGWVGQDVTAPYVDRYVDQVLSQLSPGLYFNLYTDIAQRESGMLGYADLHEGVLSVTNVVANPIRPAYEEWTLEVATPTAMVVTGSSSGPIGAVVAGSSFNSTQLAFNTAVTGLLTVGDKFVLTPRAKITVHYQAPLETWSLISTNPMNYSRPVLSSTRYGFIRSATLVPNYVTVLDSGMPSTTIVLTAISATEFTLSSTAEPLYTNATPLTVNTPYNDGRLAFTIVAGSAYAFTPGDKFFVELVNEMPVAEDLDLYYGYDLDSYDAETMVYNTISNALANYLEPIGFGYDSRFIGYDLASFNLQLAANVTDGVKWRLRALPNEGQPLNLHSGATNVVSVIATDDPLNPFAIVQLDMANDVTSEGVHSGNDPDTVFDLQLFYATSFSLEFLVDEETGNWVQAGIVPVGVPYTNPTYGLSFTIVQSAKPFIAGKLISSVHEDANNPAYTPYETIGGDVISFTVRNAAPEQTEAAGLNSRFAARLIMYGEGYHDATPARWSLTWTSASTYQLQGIYNTGPMNGSFVFSTPITVDTTAEGFSYRNDEHHLHYTVVPGIAGLLPNDAFIFDTFEHQPTFMVHGSVSGWQPDAVIDEFYWNGKIGFKIPSAKLKVFIGKYNPDPLASSILAIDGDSPWPVGGGEFITLNYLRKDTPSSTYVATSHAPGHWTLYRDGVLVADGDTELRDKYLWVTMPVGVQGTSYTLLVEGHEHTLATGHDLAIVRTSAGRAPTANDFVLLERTESDTLQISIKAKDTPHNITLLGLAPVVTDLRYVDHNANSGAPLSGTSPETAVTTGWLPILETRFDKPLSVAEFSDAATHVVVRAAATGEKVGTVESLSVDPAYPVVFRWDPSFHAKYLPLNSEATVVTLGSGMDEHMNVNMRDGVLFLLSGGGLAEDMMFADVMSVGFVEDPQWAIRGTYDDTVGVAVADGPFGGFLPGYDNLAFDNEDADGYYDAGTPYTDYFQQAQGLALLPSMTPQQQALYNELISMIGPYLDGDILTTTFNEFVTNLGANPPTLPLFNNAVNWTPTFSGFGIPAQGMAMSIDQQLGNDAVTGQTCLIENFSAGLGSFSTVSGNAALFTIGASPYGQALSVGSQFVGTPATIRKTFTPQTMSTITFKGRLDSLNADDAPWFFVTDNTFAGLFGIVMAREGFYDALRRPRIYWRTSTAASYTETPVLPGAMVLGRWYQFDVYSNLGVMYCAVTDLTTNAVITTAIGSAGAPLISAMQFGADSGGLTSGGTYADIEICDPVVDPVNTARTTIIEAMTVMAIDNGYSFDLGGFGVGAMDETPESTAILFSPNNAPVPSAGLPPPLTAYSSFQTPLVVNAPGARVIEISFASSQTITPAFYLWRPTDANPTAVPIVTRVDGRRFRFSIPAASELKLIVL